MKTGLFLAFLIVFVKGFTVSCKPYKKHQKRYSYTDQNVYTKCDGKCGIPPWHIAGQCDYNTGRCRCFYGWTGANSEYVPGTKNEIDADYCTEACHYTDHVKNTTCSYEGSNFPEVLPKQCDVMCGHDIYHNAGSCQSNGKCLCWWGWTGPGAKYIRKGKNKGRILADYCTLPCHYTPKHLNFVCGG